MADPVAARRFSSPVSLKRVVGITALTHYGGRHTFSSVVYISLKFHICNPEEPARGFPEVLRRPGFFVPVVSFGGGASP